MGAHTTSHGQSANNPWPLVETLAAPAGGMHIPGGDNVMGAGKSGGSRLRLHSYATVVVLPELQGMRRL